VIVRNPLSSPSTASKEGQKVGLLLLIPMVLFNKLLFIAGVLPTIVALNKLSFKPELKME
jgi:hypothetical protein